MLLIWPHFTGLIVGTTLLFTATYVIFQRQEIRARRRRSVTQSRDAAIPPPRPQG